MASISAVSVSASSGSTFHAATKHYKQAARNSRASMAIGWSGSLESPAPHAQVMMQAELLCPRFVREEDFIMFTAGSAKPKTRAWHNVSC